MGMKGKRTRKGPNGAVGIRTAKEVGKTGTYLPSEMLRVDRTFAEMCRRVAKEVGIDVTEITRSIAIDLGEEEC